MTIEKLIGKKVRTTKKFRSFYTVNNIITINTYPSGELDLDGVLVSLEFRNNPYVLITNKLGSKCDDDEAVGSIDKYIWVENQHGGTYVAPSDLIIPSTKVTTKHFKKWILGYVSLCIPAAMLARVIRKLTGRKGTPLERFLMEYYYDMQNRILG